MSTSQDETSRGLQYVVPELLRRTAKERDVTHAEIARKAQTSRPHVTTALTAPHNLTLSSLERFADVLGYDVSVTFRRKRNV